jgi:hypothetical protein
VTCVGLRDEPRSLSDLRDLHVSSSECAVDSRTAMFCLHEGPCAQGVSWSGNAIGIRCRDPLFLRTFSNSAACENCIAAYLGFDRFAVLKTIRELIGASCILCRYTECAIRRERRLVAQVRENRAV